MNIPYFIARRYLFSKQFSNAINIITGIAVVGIVVGTAALIIVLSIFNGLTELIEGLYAALDPDIRIVAARGSTFTEDEKIHSWLKEQEDVTAVTRTLEGQVALTYIENQAFATIKGVESSYTEVNPVEDYVYEGDYLFDSLYSVPKVIMGASLALRLSASRYDEDNPVILSYIPVDEKIRGIDALRSIKTTPVYPGGYFTVQQEYDEKYLLSDFEFARDFLEMPDQISAYELKIKDIKTVDKVKEKLEAGLPDTYRVETWYEQHKSLYKTMRSEKFVGFLILNLMLIIVSINIVGGLSIIVFEKQKDISILRSMGTQASTIRNIFLAEGLLIGGLGVLSGMLIAFVFGLLQQKYGLIKLAAGETLRIQAFPLKMQAEDFLLVFITVIAISLLAAWYPSAKAANISVTQGLRQ